MGWKLEITHSELLEATVIIKRLTFINKQEHTDKLNLFGWIVYSIVYTMLHTF